jgi:hypothetical protein
VIELSITDEQIFPAVLFLTTGRSGRVRNRRLNSGVQFHERFDQAGFTSTAWRCNYEQVTWINSHGFKGIESVQRLGKGDIENWGV